ncbi:hypothetical protein GDO86_011183 [Hymenochirus boettgeri]|uniref:Uncharacterized protein n=1 Tax=Hymenochirus boettgeri TaxID=247094 RepID=A0A8T2JIJ3_9PIPI|nr:hypothetical protein GDO86_011183 [Hymenochirus boettgeri]
MATVHHVFNPRSHHVYYTLSPHVYYTLVPPCILHTVPPCLLHTVHHVTLHTVHHVILQHCPPCTLHTVPHYTTKLFITMYAKPLVHHVRYTLSTFTLSIPPCTAIPVHLYPSTMSTSHIVHHVHGPPCILPLSPRYTFHHVYYTLSHHVIRYTVLPTCTRSNMYSNHCHHVYYPCPPCILHTVPHVPNTLSTHVYDTLSTSKVPIIKTEPTDDYESAQTCVPMNQGLTQLSKSYYSQQIMMPPDPGSCLVPGFTSCQQRNTVMSSSPNSSPKLHDLSASAYNKCISNPSHNQLGLQQPTGGVPTIQEVPRSIVVHPSSPDQSSHIMLQPQVSLHQSSSCPLGFQQTVYPNSPSSPVPSITKEPSYLQPCSPTHSAVMGQPQHQQQKVQRNESPHSQPLSLPELHEDSNHNLAPIPVTIKREPEELDQLYLDDVFNKPHANCRAQKGYH